MKFPDCEFPWLIAHLIDPATGFGVPRVVLLRIAQERIQVARRRIADAQHQRILRREHQLIQEMSDRIRPSRKSSTHPACPGTASLAQSANAQSLAGTGDPLRAFLRQLAQRSLRRIQAQRTLIRQPAHRRRQRQRRRIRGHINEPRHYRTRQGDPSAFFATGAVSVCAFARGTTSPCHPLTTLTCPSPEPAVVPVPRFTTL